MIAVTIFAVALGFAAPIPAPQKAAPAAAPAASTAASVPPNITAQRQNADQLYDEGRIEEAKAIYLRIASSYEKDFDFNLRLASCFFVSKKKEMDKAALYYGRAHRINPKNAEAEMNLGKTLSWSKQYAEAIKVFSSIVTREPGNRSALVELARAQNYSGDAQAAQATYQNYLRRWPQDRPVRLEFAAFLSWSKHIDEALENYREVLKAEPGNVNALTGQAQVLAWQGKLEDALSLYNQALKRAPRHYDALRGKGFALLWLGQYEESSKFFSEANAIKRPDAETQQAMRQIAAWRAAAPERRHQAELDVYLTPANAAIARNDLSKAIELIQKALAIAPEDRQIRFRLGEAYLWNRQWAEATQVFAKLSAERPEDLPPLRELANAQAGARQLNEAANTLRQYLQRSPDINVRVDLARVLSWAGKLDESLAAYREILATNPDNYDAALGMAQVTAWQGHSDEALAQFDALLKRRPDSREAQVGRAQVLSWSGHSKEAIPLLEEMLKARPQDREIAGILQSVQDAARQQEQQQRAASLAAADVQERIRHFEAVLQQKPNDSDTLRQLGDSSAQLGKFPQAISYYQKALAAKPDDATLMLTLAQVMSWNRSFADSINQYRALLARNDKREYRLELARVLSWAGRNAESIAEYRELLARDPKDVGVRLGLARVLSWDKQSDQALAEYEHILQDQPHNRDALFERARAYAWKGDLNTAIRMYDDLLISAPTDHEVLLAKAQALNWSGQPREAKRIIDDIQRGHPGDRDVALANAAVQSSLGRRDLALRQLDDLDKLQPGNRDVESLRRSIRQDLRPTLILGFTPSFDNSPTAIYASTATLYFSPAPQVRSYIASSVMPSFTPGVSNSEVGGEFLFGSYGRVSRWLQLRGEIGGSAATAGDSSPIGSAGATLFATDRMQFDFDVSRRFLNYLPQPVRLSINRVQLRGGWSWRANRRTTFHVDAYHERYSDENRNNGANFSVLENVLHKEHFELEAGYLFAISGFDHVGTSGFFTPTSFQRHAALGNARIKFSQKSSILFYGSLGREEVFDEAFRFDGTARASWDYQLTPRLKTSVGYGYFAVSSVGGSSAYVTHTMYSSLQYVF
ncbi:MAG: tetratricopeptide repeat protein [Terriglobales bacterium]